MDNELFREQVRSMSDEELQEEELKWGGKSAPQSVDYLRIIREEVLKRRNDWGNVACLKKSINLLREIAENGKYGESLHEKLVLIFIHSHPRINNLLSHILGFEPSFPSQRAFKDVWGIDEQALNKLLLKYPSRPLDGTLEIIINRADYEDAETVKNALLELSQFDSFVGETLATQRRDLLHQLQSKKRSGGFAERLELYFNEVMAKRAEEYEKAEREEKANHGVLKRYFAEVLEPRLQEMLTEIKTRKTTELSHSEQPGVDPNEELIADATTEAHDLAHRKAKRLRDIGEPIRHFTISEEVMKECFAGLIQRETGKVHINHQKELTKEWKAKRNSIRNELSRKFPTKKKR